MPAFRKNYWDYWKLFLTKNLYHHIVQALHRNAPSKSFQMFGAMHHLLDLWKKEKSIQQHLHIFLVAKSINLQSKLHKEHIEQNLSVLPMHIEWLNHFYQQESILWLLNLFVDRFQLDQVIVLHPVDLKVLELLLASLDLHVI